MANTRRLDDIRESLKYTEGGKLVSRFENLAIGEDAIEDEVKEDEEESEEEGFAEKIYGGNESEEEDVPEEEDEGMDNGIEEVSPAEQKLSERIKLLRHRCSAGLGNNMFDEAYEYLKGNGKGSPVEKNREELLSKLRLVI